MFGRWKKSSPNSAPATARRASETTLSMREVFGFAYQASIMRGWPEAAAAEIAWRVLWLEQRSIPGLAALAWDYAAHWKTKPEHRGVACPLLLGTILRLEKDQFETNLSPSAERLKIIRGVSTGLLMLPKLAQCASDRSTSLIAFWFIKDPPEIGGATLFHGDRVSFQGEFSALRDTVGVAYALSQKTVEGERSAFATTTTLPPDQFDVLSAMIGKDRMIATAEVAGGLRQNPGLADLFLALGPGDRSTIEAIAFAQKDEMKSANLMTSPGSPNDRFLSACAAFGWTKLVELDMPPQIAAITCAYALTEKGTLTVPLLMRISEQFKEPQ